jgi:hypothetical protein
MQALDTATTTPLAEPPTAAGTGRKRQADEDCESCKRLRDRLAYTDKLHELAQEAHSEQELEYTRLEKCAIELRTERDRALAEKRDARAERDAAVKQRDMAVATFEESKSKMERRHTAELAQQSAKLSLLRQKTESALAAGARQLGASINARYELAALKAEQENRTDATE